MWCYHCCCLHRWVDLNDQFPQINCSLHTNWNCCTTIAEEFEGDVIGSNGWSTAVGCCDDGMLMWAMGSLGHLCLGIKDGILVDVGNLSLNISSLFLTERVSVSDIALLSKACCWTSEQHLLGCGQLFPEKLKCSHWNLHDPDALSSSKNSQS